MDNLKKNIPSHVSRVTETLQKAGFEAYLVGGCVRDLLMGRSPKDWDATTNATPEEIIALFEDTFYENDYGTVGVVTEINVTHETNSKKRGVMIEVSHETGESLEKTEMDVSRETAGNMDETEAGVTYETGKEVVEVTPYRLEAKYSDSRHPDAVTFSKNIEDDLKRRDFTMNAIAYDPANGQFIDLYNGQSDIKDKQIRAVGRPEERFREDALRILRAIRLSTELGFAIESETQNAILSVAPALEKISIERIRDEFIRIIMSDNPMAGIVVMHRLGVLKYVVPELEVGVKVKQNGDHIYDVWEHNLRALNHSSARDWPLHIRLGAVFHDVAKPQTRRWSKEKNDYTFYGHDVVGGRMTKKILERLKFPKKMTETVAKLVQYHLFFTDIDKITLSAVRRLVAGVGQENVWDLMKIRACDRIGMGRPKEKPYRLRKYEAMIEEAMRAPVSVGMLKIDGEKIMEVTRETPGPKIGLILHALLEEVLEDPAKNTTEYLEKQALKLIQMPVNELRALADKGKEEQEKKEAEEVAVIRKRHHVE